MTYGEGDIGALVDIDFCGAAPDASLPGGCGNPANHNQLFFYRDRRFEYCGDSSISDVWAFELPWYDETDVRVGSVRWKDAEGAWQHFAVRRRTIGEQYDFQCEDTQDGRPLKGQGTKFMVLFEPGDTICTTNNRVKVIQSEPETVVTIDLEERGVVEVPLVPLSQDLGRPFWPWLPETSGDLSTIDLLPTSTSDDLAEFRNACAEGQVAPFQITWVPDERLEATAFCTPSGLVSTHLFSGPVRQAKVAVLRGQPVGRENDTFFIAFARSNGFSTAAVSSNEERGILTAFLGSDKIRSLAGMDFVIPQLSMPRAWMCVFPMARR